LSPTGELVEDNLGSGGPDEGFGRGIVILDEAVDGGLKATEVVAALATVLWHFWGTCSPNLELRAYHISRSAGGMKPNRRSRGRRVVDAPYTPKPPSTQAWWNVMLAPLSMSVITGGLVPPCNDQRELAFYDDLLAVVDKLAEPPGGGQSPQAA
jgi:hypothetical protein